MMRPKTGSPPHQGFSPFLWFVVGSALSAYCPEGIKSHNPLPALQQGLDTFLYSAGRLEVTCAYFIFSVLCVKSSYILDRLVKSTQVIFVNIMVRSITLCKGESGESKMITRNVDLCLI